MFIDLETGTFFPPWSQSVGLINPAGLKRCKSFSCVAPYLNLHITFLWVQPQLLFVLRDGTDAYRMSQEIEGRTEINNPARNTSRDIEGSRIERSAMCFSQSMTCTVKDFIRRRKECLSGNVKNRGPTAVPPSRKVPGRTDDGRESSLRTLGAQDNMGKGSKRLFARTRTPPFNFPAAPSVTNHLWSGADSIFLFRFRDGQIEKVVAEAGSPLINSKEWGGLCVTRRTQFHA